ncbi:MAG: MarR family transcriptional regulator [Alphaproteobacteria bacterium]|nr:MarR family transcriptional regulator [Alphaproteobacteria bacterium]MDE2494652.1 MarR family transcriptional regulator [Alphaproteobacteria bacterium]
MTVREKRVPRGRELAQRDYRLLAEFRRLLREFLAFSEAEALDVGLSPQQHQVLLAIKGSDGPTTVGDLAEYLFLRHNSAVGLVDRLERLNLLARRSDPIDGRRVILGLTGEAEKLLASLTTAHREELRRLTPLLKPLLMELER